MNAHAHVRSHTNLLALLWLPFVAVWHLVTWTMRLVGRLLAIVFGVLLMVVGVLASLTVVGAIVGLPLIVVGFIVTLRGIF
ncbi:MAG: TMEM43 family protein [Chloroflexi bacterium]|nr:TMEM43 family protein [Chloroflexota bacterium]